MIGRLFRKLLGITLVMAGVCLILDVSPLWASPGWGVAGPSTVSNGTWFAAVFVSPLAVALIAIGCRLIVPGRPGGDPATRKKKFAGFEEYF